MTLRKVEGLVALCALTWACTPTEVPPAARVRSAVEMTTQPGGPDSIVPLGTGYNGVKEEFRSQCIIANVGKIPSGTAALTFETVLSRDEVSRLLGIEVGGKLGFKKWSLSGSSKIARSTVDKTFSITSYFANVFRHEIEFVDQQSVTWLIAPGSPLFAANCSDWVLWRKERGGKLIVMYAIDFRSTLDKSEFEGQLGGNFSIANLNATVTRNRTAFSSRASIRVEAYQVGGNGAQLAQVLGAQGSDGAKAWSDCSMGAPEACITFIGNAATYAGGAFASSISDGRAADTLYVHKDWLVALRDGDGVDPGAVPQPRPIPADLLASRAGLVSRFEGDLEFLNRAEMLQSGRFAVSSYLAGRLPLYVATARANLTILADAHTACWEIDDPSDAVARQACATAADLGVLKLKGYRPGLTMEKLDPEVVAVASCGGVAAGTRCSLASGFEGICCQGACIDVDDGAACCGGRYATGPLESCCGSLACGSSGTCTAGVCTCEEGTSLCGGRCIPNTVPILSGYGQCANDCDCGAAAGYYCWMGPQSCMPTQLVENRFLLSQRVPFTGNDGVWTELPASMTTFSNPSSRSVTISVPLYWTWVTPSYMGLDVRLMLDGNEIWRQNAASPRVGVGFSTPRTIPPGQRTLVLQVRSRLFSGPPMTGTVYGGTPYSPGPAPMRVVVNRDTSIATFPR